MQEIQDEGGESGGDLPFLLLKGHIISIYIRRGRGREEEGERGRGREGERERIEIEGEGGEREFG